MEEGFVVDGIRAICATLDSFIYGWIIPMLYDFIMALAEVNPFKDNAIEDFATRVYSLLALFMLFKISFSFITYIVNPEQMVDKTKGASNIIKNVIIVLILIIITPRAFSLLRETQSAILHDNVLPKFILGYGNDELRSPKSLVYYDGTKGYCTDSSNNIDYNGVINAATTGDYISLMIFRNFFNVDDDYFNQDPNTVRKSLIDNNFCDQVNNVTVKNFLHASLYNSAPEFWDGTYVIDYWIIISTVVGVGVALMLLTSCMDVAVRSIKLGFLQIISPIPIISYMDPNSGKNGMFKKWLTEVGKTWANLFIRLASLFFAVYAISQLEFLDLSNISIFSSDDVAKYSFFIELFLIIGALMFAKQLPQLLETLIPGLKSSGSFQLNPFKKIANEAIGGKLVTGGAAALGGAALIGGSQALSNAVAFGRNKYNLHKKIKSLEENGNDGDNKKLEKLQREYNSMGIRRFGSTFSGGMLGGAKNGLQSGFKTGEKGSANVFKNLKTDLEKGDNARNNRTAIRNYNREAPDDQKYGWFERNITERVDRVTGVKNEDAGYGYYDKKIKELERKISDNNDSEAAVRTGLANYCVNNGINQSLVEELHKLSEGKAKDTTDMINAIRGLTTEDRDSFNKKYGFSGIADLEANVNTWFSHYTNNLQSSLKNIDSINTDTRELKAKKREYEDIAKTRRNIEKK